jgi:ankyrin repeat protein
MTEQNQSTGGQTLDINQQLVQAVDKRDMRAVCRCLDAGADPSTSGREGMPLIFCSGSWPITVELIKAGAGVTVRDRQGSTILHKAAGENEVDAINAALEHGLDIETLDSLGEAALFEAVRYGALEAVRELIELGADLSVRNNEGDTLMDKVDYEAIATCVDIQVELEQAGGERSSDEAQTEEEEGAE